MHVRVPLGAGLAATAAVTGTLGASVAFARGTCTGITYAYNKTTGLVLNV